MNRQLKIFRTMKTYGLVVALLLTTAFCSAQDIDEVRMERDLEVAQNILATMVNRGTEREVIFYGRKPFEGSYVEGYGVIFSATQRFGNTIISTGEGSATYHFQGGARKYDRDPLIISSGGNVFRVKLDSLTEVQDKEWVEKMKTFLVDYADLIGQLKPENKIMVTSGICHSGNWYALESRGSGKPFLSEGPTVEILKKDLIDYKSGKINRNETLKRVKVIDAASKEELAQDVELLASIFERLYKPDLSSTYYLSGGLTYGSIPEFGVVYNMRVYSSSRKDHFHRIITRNQSGLSQSERDEVVKDMYPEFLRQLKRNIVQYGRTVKSLKDNDLLMFKVRLTQCNGCGIPKNLELSIKASELKNYDMGKFGESAAIEKISVTEIGVQ